MRTSRFLLATLREDPSDAEVISQRLMLRAGMISRLAAGIYSWLPLGLRVLRRAGGWCARRWTPWARRSC